MTEDEKFQKEDKKDRHVTWFGVLILILAVILLSGCVIYSYKFNKNMAEKNVKVQDEYKKLREQVIADAKKSEEISPEGVGEETEDNSKKVEDTENSSENGEEEKPQDGQEESATYENFIEGKKFTFKYPSLWNENVMFLDETKEDGSLIVTCYHSEQYHAHQEGALETGEIFHLLMNKNPRYQSKNNDQYKISEKDGYCAYYEEPSKVTYDYVNHSEYAKVYKMIYDGQGKIFRSFTFN